jgi:hypothetical protein
MVLKIVRKYKLSGALAQKLFNVLNICETYGQNAVGTKLACIFTETVLTLINIEQVTRELSSGHAQKHE